MPDPKNPPAWMKKKVYDINLQLINELKLSWPQVIEFWEGIIEEAKIKIDAEN